MAFVGGERVASFFRQLGRLRVREVPDFLRKTVTRENIQSNGEKYLEEYREKLSRPGPVREKVEPKNVEEEILCFHGDKG